MVVIQLLRYRHYTRSLNPDECICVDGVAPAKLNLSHWPGNRTPPELKHDLSTGMALKLAQSPDRERWLQGITTVTNNHWDTDGLCSVYAVLHPQEALQRGDVLLAAAMAGDFTMFTTPEGVKIDLTLTALTRHPESPVASDKFSDDLTRRQAQYEFGLELLPKLIEDPDLPLEWIGDDYRTIQNDLRTLREDESMLEVFAALDFAVVRSDCRLSESAVNTAAGVDRYLEVVHVDDSFLYSCRYTTLSWFELALKRERPDWTPLAAELTALTGSPWHAEKLTDPTPQLWHGYADGPRPCSVSPERIVGVVRRFFTKHPFLPAGL